MYAFFSVIKYIASDNELFMLCLAQQLLTTWPNCQNSFVGLIGY